MRHLRQQVDRIDLKILRLLQQRTKLSGQIGQTKRRHGAVIYVPEREAELLAHVRHLSRGKLPPHTVTAIYREILSGSRAAQGQQSIGLLQASADAVLLPARWHFGACDEFRVKKTWPALAHGFESGTLALALLTGEDLVELLQAPRLRGQFFGKFAVVGDFSSLPGSRKIPLARRVFIVTPRGKGAACEANRLLILIECKSTVNTVKSLLNHMPDCTIRTEQVIPGSKSAFGGTAFGLAYLTLAHPVDGLRVTSQLLAARQSTGLTMAILGVYPGTEEYGG
jgi:chorismate mutase